jgi:hypothetical protein
MLHCKSITLLQELVASKATFMVGTMTQGSRVGGVVERYSDLGPLCAKAVVDEHLQTLILMRYELAATVQTAVVAVQQAEAAVRKADKIIAKCIVRYILQRSLTEG